MAPPTQPREGKPAAYTGPRFLGAPVGDFSLPQTFMITLASGAIAFFASTFLAIMTLLVLFSLGHRVDFSLAYRWVGAPAGLLAMCTAGAYLGFLLVHRMRRRP